MGLATLRVITTRGAKPVDLQVTWLHGYDDDASIGVPNFLKEAWDSTASSLSKRAQDSVDGTIKPYPTLPRAVSADKLMTSATGFYAIAKLACYDAFWTKMPPYPQIAPIPPGAVS